MLLKPCNLKPVSLPPQALEDAHGSPAWSAYLTLLDEASGDARLVPLAELLHAMLHAEPDQRPDMGHVCTSMLACLAALRS